MNRLRLKTKIKYPPYFDRIIFLIAATYLIVVGAWLYRQYRQSIIVRNQESSDINYQNLGEDNLNEENPSLEIPVNLNPGEIPPLPSVLDNSPPEISALPIPTPPPLVNGMDLMPPPLESTAQIPDQIPQSLPTPPPPTPVTPSRPNTVPIISNNDFPPPPPINNSTSENVETTSATNNSQKKNALVGVIQLPDGAGFALFNINNITERVPVGNAIASTGWTLGSIYDNEVIINRNNQSLSLRVGESF